MRRRRGGVGGLALVLAALLAAGCGGGDGADEGPRSFVGKASNVALYVTWTRDGRELTGSLTQAVLDAAKDDVATKRAAISGTIVGEGVTLDLADPYGEASRLTGTLRGDTLELEYLSGSTGVTTVRMQEGDGGDFNSLLATLSDTAAESEVAETANAAETAETEHVAQLVEEVFDDIAALRTALAASLPAKRSSLKDDLERLEGELRSVRRRARAALSSDRLNACSHASLVKTATDSLASGVDALKDAQQRAARGAAEVTAAISKLLDDFSTLQSEDPKHLPEDAPTRATVNRVVRSARRKLSKVGGSRDDVVDDAEAMLEEARGLELRASIACRTGA